MKKHLLYTPILILFILGCSPKQIEPLPQKGLLWEISGNGLRNSSYLFGTAHIPEGMQILDSIKIFDSIFNLTSQLICEVQYSDVIKQLTQKKGNSNNSPFKPWPNPDSTYNNLLSIEQKAIIDADTTASKLFKRFEKAKFNIRPFGFLDFLKVSPIANNDKVNVLIPDGYLQRLAKKRNVNIVSLDSGKEYQKLKDSLNSKTSQLSQISYRNEINLLMYFIENRNEIDSLQNKYLEEVSYIHLFETRH